MAKQQRQQQTVTRNKYRKRLNVNLMVEYRRQSIADIANRCFDGTLNPVSTTERFCTMASSLC